MKKGNSKKASVRRSALHLTPEIMDAAVGEELAGWLEDRAESVGAKVQTELARALEWYRLSIAAPRLRMVDLLDEETKVKVEETAPADVGLEEQCAEIVSQWARGFPAGVDDPAALSLQMDGWMKRLKEAVDALTLPPKPLEMAFSFKEKSAYARVQDLATAFNADDLYEEIRVLADDVSLHENIQNKLSLALHSLVEAKGRILDAAACCRWCGEKDCVCRFFKSDTPDTPAWLQGARFLATGSAVEQFKNDWQKVFGEQVPNNVTASFILDGAGEFCVASFDDTVNGQGPVYYLGKQGQIWMVTDDLAWAILVQDNKSKLPPEAR